ncbi:MAG: hypothetical protein JNL24_04605 [Bacteroidia bacterium]|nr:hypothetical protein [Bacteroidia bacterium]
MKRTTYILILLAISLISLIVWRLFYSNPAISNITLALFSSGLFAFFIEFGFHIADRRRFSYMKGKWERTHFFNRNGQSYDNGYKDESTEYSSRVIKEISLTYHEDGEYHGKVFYDEGPAEFIIYLNKSNPLSGSGTYQYLETKSQKKTADIGYFDFIVDLSKNKIHISHENKLPSGTAKGTEIWQRT